ncbi:MAG TPA: diguanylate cyclase [Vicinamibacteria bacterium]
MKVLVADDSPVSRHLLETTLRQLGYDVVLASDGKQALDVLLSADGPRLAVVDWMMPGADGLEVCRAVRQRTAPYTYVILLTARDRQEDVLAGLESGADDFLRKPFDHVELRARLRSGARVLELQEALFAAVEALRQQATRDSLTGLWNRALVLDGLARELHRAQREQQPLSVVIGDLDHFKKVNDTYGHPGGDAVLREAASRMRTALRGYDLVARYGGEEFLAVLPGCDEASARQVAERLRAAIAERPMAAGDAAVTVTMSLGVAAASPGADAVALIQAADTALYRAKAKGRDCVVAAAPSAPEVKR